MKTTFVLLLAIAVCLQVGWTRPSQNGCPIVTAPDGSTYDLSYISDYGVQQAFVTKEGEKYAFNVSICNPVPEGCAGTCDGPGTAGVCMFWGTAPELAKCYGVYSTLQIIPLNKKVGVQIRYNGGDICGSCTPSGPRSSIITLTCRYDVTDPSVINWTSVYGAEPMQPPIQYLNGTFNCDPDEAFKALKFK